MCKFHDDCLSVALAESKSEEENIIACVEALRSEGSAESCQLIDNKVRLRESLSSDVSSTLMTHACFFVLAVRQAS